MTTFIPEPVSTIPANALILVRGPTGRHILSQALSRHGVTVLVRKPKRAQDRKRQHARRGRSLDFGLFRFDNILQH